MRYQTVVSARFLSRPNRFVATVLLEGKEVGVHVKNTGRCKELLVPGAQVYLEDFTKRPGKRNYLYDLIAVEKGNLLINMDSQAPNKVAKEALEAGTLSLPGMASLSRIQPECVYGASRFDFAVEDSTGKKGYLEVKGVTLEKDGVAAFPDAPTDRGVKHLRELCHAKEEGLQAYLLFLIQMRGMQKFVPNDETHKAFGEMLRLAAAKGVTLLAYECNVTPDSLTLASPVEIVL